MNRIAAADVKDYTINRGVFEYEKDYSSQLPGCRWSDRCRSGSDRMWWFFLQHRFFRCKLCCRFF